jgi:F-type H+-transporting ATPase subunit delta
MSRLVLQGVSRTSFAGARDALDGVIGTSDVDLDAVADQLFAVTAVLDREGGLRRALTDPARSDDDRVGPARAVFAAWLSGPALDVALWTVRAPWSRSRDLADTLELLAVEAVVAAADKNHRLDAVEDELFRLARVVAANHELRIALSDRAAPVESRVALVDDLLRAKVTAETLRLVKQAVSTPRGRNFDHTIEAFGEVAADRRSRVVAQVTAAVPLTEAQRDRLAAALAQMYGHEVHLNIEIDPEVIGGIRVELGDEVIDGSIVSRLDDARRRFAR